MKRIMVIARRGHFSRLREITGLLTPHAAIDLWSDERLVVHWGGQWWLDGDPAVPSAAAEEVVGGALSEIIRRCRLLRMLPRGVAEGRLLTAASRWYPILSKGEYDAVISIAVDSYTLDTLQRICHSLNIPFIVPSACPFPGRIRFTSRRGQLLGKVPVASDLVHGEVERFASNTEFRPEWVFGLDASTGATIARRLAVDLIKPAASFLYRNAYRDHYSYSFPPIRYLRGRMFATPMRAITALRCERRSTSNLPEDYIFLPLQFSPESSTDYWMDGPLAGDYYAAMIQIIDAFAAIGPVVLKEHPVALGRRPRWFMESVLENPSVEFAPIGVPVGALIDGASVTCGPGSTSLLEALAANRPAVFLGSEPYYGKGAGIVAEDFGAETLRDAAHRAITAAGDSRANDLNHEVFAGFVAATATGSVGTYAPIGENPFRHSGEPHMTPESKLLFESVVHTCKLGSARCA